MSLIHSDALADLLPTGSVIQGVSVEYGDEFNFDFIILNSAYDILIESVDGDSSLVEIKGDLNAVVELPIVAAYSTQYWHGPNAITEFHIRTGGGEVVFVWEGYARNDVQARTC